MAKGGLNMIADEDTRYTLIVYLILLVGPLLIGFIVWVNHKLKREKPPIPTLKELTKQFNETSNMCSGCGHKNSKNAIYCIECGTTIKTNISW